MDTATLQIAAALAMLSDAELHALIATAKEVPQIAPRFVAWIEHIADWEMRRRNGVHYRLQSPGAAIPPAENAASTGSAMLLRGLFAKDAPPVAALFGAIAGALGSGAPRH